MLGFSGERESSREPCLEAGAKLGDNFVDIVACPTRTLHARISTNDFVQKADRNDTQLRRDSDETATAGPIRTGRLLDLRYSLTDSAYG